MNTELTPTHPTEATEAEFAVAFQELCNRYDQIEEGKEHQTDSIVTSSESPENNQSIEYLEPAAENIADAARSIVNGDLRSAEESFGVAMALGLPGAAIMNVAQDALNMVKPENRQQ